MRGRKEGGGGGGCEIDAIQIKNYMLKCTIQFLIGKIPIHMACNIGSTQHL